MYQLAALSAVSILTTVLTFGLVLFTLLILGLTIERLVKALGLENNNSPPEADSILKF